MLSPLARRECTAIAVIGAMFAATGVAVAWWWLVGLAVVATAALLAFFRDPKREVPSPKNIMVSPADGKISSIHEIEHYAPLGGPATCIRIFLSVLDVHINRCPCHAAVVSVTHKAGKHRNALNPESAEDNESTLMVLEHPTRRYPIAAVRQVAGLLARTVVCAAKEGEIFQRGDRYGLIKLGSTTELYIPSALAPHVRVRKGERVQGALTILASFTPPSRDADQSIDKPEAVATHDSANTANTPNTPNTPDTVGAGGR